MISAQIGQDFEEIANCCDAEQLLFFRRQSNELELHLDEFGIEQFAHRQLFEKPKQADSGVQIFDFLDGVSVLFAFTNVQISLFSSFLENRPQKRRESCVFGHEKVKNNNANNRTCFLSLTEFPFVKVESVRNSDVVLNFKFANLEK